MLQKNILQFVIAATAIGAASAGKPAEEMTIEGDAEVDMGNCHDCGCFTCDSVTEVGDGTIDIEVGHCKDGEISWMCCTGVDGEEGACDVMGPCIPGEGEGKCNGIGKGTGLTINVPIGSTFFSINTHDGQTAGDGNMNVNGVCGGSGKNQGGGCGKDPFTAHCEIDFDIANDCGYTAPEGAVIEQMKLEKAESKEQMETIQVEENNEELETIKVEENKEELETIEVEEEKKEMVVEEEKKEMAVEEEKKEMAVEESKPAMETEKSDHFDINKTLYGAPIPDCGDDGQNESFQGRPLTNRKGECDKINICHGSAVKWNLITVSRSSSSKGGLPGHRDFNHNNYEGKGKLPDYYPSAKSVPNPNGAGKYGSLDGQCNFIPHPDDTESEAVSAGETIIICEEDDGEFTMDEIEKADRDGQAQPGDVVEIDGRKYTLTEECDLHSEEREEVKEEAQIREEVVKKESEEKEAVEEKEKEEAIKKESEEKEAVDEKEEAERKEKELKEKEEAERKEKEAEQKKKEAEEKEKEEAQIREEVIRKESEEKQKQKEIRTIPGPTKASGSGDPHFKTWTGDKYDYHGECDLVLVDNPTFMDGLGLRIHIRTTRVKYFSYIEQVAVQIGEDVLEFNNDIENFYINGVVAEANKQHHKTHLGGFIVRRDAKALSIRLHDEGSVSRHNGSNAKIDLHTRKNGFPAVIVDGGNTDVFKNSLGLLGDWTTGKRLARDGKTEMNGEDATDFALEWQVRDTEPSLFKDARFPQFPTICTPPGKKLNNRLGVSSFEAEAEKACAHWKEDKDDCIFDVIATRDVLVADEGHIVHIE